MEFASGYLISEAKCPVLTTRLCFNTTFFWNCSYAPALLRYPIPGSRAQVLVAALHSGGLISGFILWLFPSFPLANSTCSLAAIYKFFPGASLFEITLLYHLPGLLTLEGEAIKLEVKGLYTCPILLHWALQELKWGARRKGRKTHCWN